MRSIFLLFLSCLTGLIVAHAQDPYMQRAAASMPVDDAATALTRAYQSDLGMTVEQGEKFREKVAEYLILRRELRKAELPAKERLRRLNRLSAQETAAMKTVLTLTQFRAYKKLKRKYQPVQVVVDPETKN